MNLYELQKEINWKRIVIKNTLKILQEIEEQLKSIPTANISEPVVQGGKKDGRLEKLIERKIMLEERVEMLENELKDYEPLLEELEELLKEYNDVYQQIYFEYYIKGYSAEKIGLRHNYSRAQVYNIINKIDEELKNKTLDKTRLKI